MVTFCATADAVDEAAVLMPVYNGARYVRGAIESVLKQTHPRFELLIMDDGSTDATPASWPSTRSGIRASAGAVG